MWFNKTKRNNFDRTSKFRLPVRYKTNYLLYKKVNKLEKDVPYKIIEIKKVTDKFGTIIILKIEKNNEIVNVQLPKRYEKITSESILNINNNNYLLEYLSNQIVNVRLELLIYQKKINCNNTI